MSQMIREILVSVKALLGGTAAFIAGNSLLGLILPLRMESAGYPVALTGAIMAAYYLGLALGGLRAKHVIFKIGHIRAFAVFAAVTSITALAYAGFFHPVAWLILRIVNGFCIAGMTATIESWLNTRSSNKTRGRVLGFYMLTLYLAIASGQMLVNLSDVASADLFMLAASLIADQIAGRDNVFAPLVKASRFSPLKGAKGIAEETASVVKSLIKDYVTHRETTQLSQLMPGKGAMVEFEDESLAAYRAPDGTLIAVSPVCTHMKCKVHWNSVETSWDCPCHGSRFAPDGSVIEGPAIEPLERRFLTGQ